MLFCLEVVLSDGLVRSQGEGQLQKDLEFSLG